MRLHRFYQPVLFAVVLFAFASAQTEPVNNGNVSNGLYIDNVSPLAGYQPTCPLIVEPDQAIDFMLDLITFRMKQRDNANGGFYTAIDRQGTWTGANEKALCGQSRIAYAFVRAFMVTGDETYLEYARHALKFLYDHGWNNGWYFITDIAGNYISHWGHNDWWGFQQHYALVGPTAMVEATGGKVNWNDGTATDHFWLMRGIASNYTNLWDANPVTRGYFNNANTDWSNKWGKGFHSTVDGMTTHALLMSMIYDSLNHKNRLLELADNVVDHLVGNMPVAAAGFPEMFNADWTIDNSNSNMDIGHGFKTAWVLQRAYLLNPARTEYREAGHALMENLWNHGCYDTVYGAPFSYLNWQTGAITGTNKDFWMVEQGLTSGLINYYTAATQEQRDRYMRIADGSLNFFLDHNIDPVYDEAYSVVSRDGSTVVDGNKGGLFTAGYHSVELGYYTYLYSSLYYHHSPVQLYYLYPAESGERNIKLTPIEIEDNLLKITAMTLDGAVYTDYNPDTRTVHLPSGVGGKLKVTFGLVIPENHTITASAGVGGSITPQGAVVVPHGASQSFSIVPEAGYQIASVVVDGSSVGAVGSYTFQSVTAPHTISASFSVPSPVVYQINTGSASTATPFTGDQYGSGGTMRTVTNTVDMTGVSDPAPQLVYQSERYGNSTYTIPNLTPLTDYLVRLHFAELYWTATGSRVFNVAINGTTVLGNFDIFATTGARYKAVVREFTATANGSGQIMIAFTTVTDNATIEGIEILNTVQDNPPAIVTPAAANPAQVSAGTTQLTVLADDDFGEAALTYTWSTTGTPPATAAFSVNGTNAAKTTTATFSKSGPYAFLVTVKDQRNHTVTSPVSVTVNQTLTGIAVSPASATLLTSATQQFAGSAQDQFGNAMASQPPISWSVSGGGSISGSGLFTAGAAAGGPYTVTAQSGAISGTASVTVSAQPTIVYQINTGSSSAATPFSGDQFGSGGTMRTVTNTIDMTGVSDPAPQLVYQSERYGNSTYTIPNLTVGAQYTVRLHFAELYWTATGQRRFNIVINGTAVLSNFDIYATTGARYKAVVREFTATSNGSGQIVIAFTTVTDNATVEGIEVVPAIPNDPPTVATAAAADPNPVSGASTALSVLGADDNGESNLTYTWAATGSVPAAVTFSANGSNAAKNTIATFSKAGAYTLQATIRDQGNLTVTSAVIVTVNQTLTSIAVSPASATVNVSGTQQFTATARDQFAASMTTQPAIAWSVSGGGTISPSGLFTAGTTAGGPYTVTATSGTIGATATVTVTSSSDPCAGVIGGGSGLQGATFGLTPPWAAGSEYCKAADGNTSTFYDASQANAAYTGLDLGSAKVIGKIRFYPRSGFASRMSGGKFQGSNTSSSSGFVDLFTISATPAVQWNEVTVANPAAYRWVRYLAPTGGYGNIAEMEFYSTLETKYEAEFAARTGGANVNTNHSGYSGTGFVDGYYNSTTAQTAFTVSVSSAGTCTLKLRYSAGNGTSANTGLYINGVKIKNISCPATSNWDTWADETETVTLNAGNNTIAYKAESSSTSCINLDYITVTR